MSSTYVLDTNVISSFKTAGWLDAIEIWLPKKNVVASEAVWEEFQDYTSIEQPDWLSIEEAQLERVETQTPGALARADWSCIAVVEEYEDARLVTNDRGIHTVAKRRGIPREWGTRFLLRTFQRCGLSKDELEDGVEAYVDDLRLPEDVEDELRNTTKDSSEIE